MPKGDGTISVPAFDLPMSSFLPSTTKDRLIRRWTELEKTRKSFPSDPATYPHDKEVAMAQRRWTEREYFPRLVALLDKQYRVRIRPIRIAGVKAEVISPFRGRSAGNRVLINLHGGGFVMGARLGGRVESIPIAARGNMDVVSVNYRLAPEHVFPAATEDVMVVYRNLLREHGPRNIGIFGCSAGALLTAQTVARIQKEKLPVPGAVGMFCAGASYWGEGDSAHSCAVIRGSVPERMEDHPYFKGVKAEDPLAFPIRSPRILSRFPPSLLISSTRDIGLSSVVHTHSRLVQLGVDADLHVWEGLKHVFFYDPNLAESGEVHDVAVRFFHKHLGDEGLGDHSEEEGQPTGADWCQSNAASFQA